MELLVYLFLLIFVVLPGVVIVLYYLLLILGGIFSVLVFLEEIYLSLKN